VNHKQQARITDSLFNSCTQHKNKVYILPVRIYVIIPILYQPLFHTIVNILLFIKPYLFSNRSSNSKMNHILTSIIVSCRQAHTYTQWKIVMLLSQRY